MEKSRVFVDSNYFIALFNKSDTLYDRAIEIGTILDKKCCQLVMSDLIFLEIVTVLSQRKDRTLAIEVGEYLRSHPDITIFHSDEMLNEKTWHIFQTSHGKNISFVDCSVIALMKEEHITELLTFDQTDFKQLQTHHRFQFYPN